MVLQQKKRCKCVDQVSDSCDSMKKTEVVKGPTITVNGQLLQVVDKFTYLGSTLSRVVHIDDEVNARIADDSILDQSDTKLKVYRSVVLPTLLHACETWTVYQRHAKRLTHIHTSSLKKLL